MSAMKEMKAMKTMKSMKAMKAMKAKTSMKKVSAWLAKRHVFVGKSGKTSGRLSKGDLVTNRAGKVVSKRMSLRNKKNPWIAACSAARKALGITGFATAKKGSALYRKAKQLYKK